ncbi:unnamed protein product, partial [Callosobruchus maculatus]
ICFNI